MKRAIALLFVSSTAYAGGTSRPNLISARGVGIGGAFTGIADDPTAVWFNPAALDDLESQVMVGGELVYGPRSYTPMKADGTTGPAQDTTVVAPVPAIGTVLHFTDSDDLPSRFSLGFGIWNTFGGQLSYEKTGMPALDATSDIVIEADVAASFHVSDRFSVGAAARFGLGLFHVESTAMPFDSDLSASGVGVGMSLAAMFKPTDTLRIGVTWRSPLRVTTEGDGTIAFSGPAEHHEVRHEQKWPQQASVGVGYQATPLWKLAAQIDWTGWSIMDQLTVEFPTSALTPQIYPEYWNDSWTFRGGAEFAVSSSVAVRAGAYYDTAAVPDRTIERQYTDADKLGVSAGASVKLGAWRVDVAGDAVPGGTRTVENNSAEVMGFTPLVNKAPGDYKGSLYTFELAVARPF
jgi:long-chain fatty acid transport protein